MKIKKILFALIALLLGVTFIVQGFAASETQPSVKAETKSSDLFRQTAKLIQIYSKIQAIAGKRDLKALDDTLDGLNQVLDEVIAFQASFTPAKKEKIQKRLNEIKQQTSRMVDIERLEIKNHALSLSTSLLQLVKELAETEE